MAMNIAATEGRRAWPVTSSFETRKEATTPKQFFYQVRAISSCTQTLRGFSAAEMRKL